MIAIKHGASIVTRLEDGSTIGSFYVGSNSEMVGYSDNFILLRNGRSLYTVDPRGSQLGFMVMTGDQPINRVTNSGFSIQYGTLLESYGPDCVKRDSCYV